LRSDILQYFISHYNKEYELNFPDDLLIYDTTLRDGEQTPGVCFSPDEKLEIARKLDQFKIHQIEAGFPIVSQKEKETVKKIASEGLDADILGLTRTKPEDIDAALVVSRRQSPRQLQFAPDSLRLVGWQNTQTGDQRGELGVPLAFAGIHLLSPQLFPLMASMPEKFSIITFYLNICTTRQLIGYEQPVFRFMDAGKAEQLAEADAFMKSLMAE
jgi:hypothetical protein